jgi:protein-S-isoprenylcysteine O-methyltransferase Ste14
MRLFALIGLVGIVGGRLAAWLVKRRRPQLADALRLSTMIFTQAVVAVILGSTAIQLAREDNSLRLALAALVGLLALGAAALGGLYAWAWLRNGADGEQG